MKNSFKLHEAQEAKKEKDLADWVPQKPCVQCGKKLSGAYGRHMRGDQEVWTCSGKCERSYNGTETV
jgi:hypothetical protein